MKITGIVALIFISCLALLATKPQGSFAEMVNSEISHSIPVIYSDSLHALLIRQNILLLDARGFDEYKISHIPNAVWVGYKNFNRYSIREKVKSKLIIVYCSIGYRSEKVSEKLRSYGYTSVYNLWGGIFDWINKGFQVVDMNNNATLNIHPYNEKWGKWLTRGVKKYE